MKQHPRILLVEPNPDRARDISHALRHEDWAEIVVVPNTDKLARLIEEHKPDGVVVDMDNPNQQTVQMISAACDAEHRPVVLFVDRSSEEVTQTAVDAGFSGYVVNGLDTARVKPILQTAMARFDRRVKVRSELDQAKQALSDRKTIDRAKGILMKSKGIDEPQAYDLLRKTAMDQGRKMIDIAQGLVTSADLLG